MKKLSFIDLGLSVKWAEFNLGALPGPQLENWYGLYYAWGETIGHKDNTSKQFSREDYKFGRHYHIKYNDFDEKILLDKEDDVAAIKFPNIRIPTTEEFKELINISNEWVENYNDIFGLNGRVFTGSNGSSIFIPSARTWRNNNYNFVFTDDCCLWSKTRSKNIPNIADSLYFGPKSITTVFMPRYYGFPIRLIQEK